MKCRCKHKCKCGTLWSCLAHLLYLVHRMEQRLLNQHHKHEDTLTHLHFNLENDMHTWKHPCKLVETLTYSHYASHNCMKSLRTYFHPHLHTHVHFSYAHTFTLHKCTLADTNTHSHAKTHLCTNLDHLHIWLSHFKDSIISPLHEFVNFYTTIQISKFG